MNTIATINRAVELHFDKGLTYGLVAKELGLSRSAVAGIVHRNRKPGQVSPTAPGFYQKPKVVIKKIDPKKMQRNAQC